VSEKGTLIIDGTPTIPANLNLGAVTLTANSASQNVIVGKNGSITFAAANSTLAGNIKVKGGLVAGYDATTIPVSAPIPSSVDLTEATLSATTGGVKTLLFAPIENYTFRIGKVDVTSNSLTLRESRGLSIGLVTNGTTATALGIPPDVTTIIEEAVAGTGALTIDNLSTAAQSAILKLGYVGGNTGGVTLGSAATSKLILEPIDGNNITVATTLRLGTNVPIITLGNDAAAQSAVLNKIKGGALNLGANPFTIAAPAAINTVLTTTGALTIGADTTFNVSPGATLGSITIQRDKNLILASDVVIARGTGLSLTEGVYQAVQADATIPTTGIIATVASPDAGLKIGASVADIAENYISLTSDVGGAATFTPAVSTGIGYKVEYGKGGILLPSDTTTGAMLTVSGTLVGKITVAGEGVAITLGFLDTTLTHSGTLRLSDGAKLVTADTLLADSTDGPTTGDYASGGTLEGTENTTDNSVDITPKGTATEPATITSATKTS
jgi:hypothetical protein